MQIYNKLSSKWDGVNKEKAKSVYNKHKEAITWLKYNLPDKQHLASGVLGGLMLLTAHASSTKAQSPKIPESEFILSNSGQNAFIVTDLKSLLPSEFRELTPVEEEKIAAVLARDFQIPLTASVNNIRLNRSYGIIGQEQHLARYPGDTIFTHFDNPNDQKIYSTYGMAPGLGAWRYFAQSKDTMTEKESDMEKYYIAVQTFLSPGYEGRSREYSDFFKFRKMLVVNPQNGKGIVTVIGDVGPASWTGKHLGGSPEVMKYLERVDGSQRGPVLYFFINDPEDKIELGPVET